MFMIRDKQIVFTLGLSMLNTDFLSRVKTLTENCKSKQFFFFFPPWESGEAFDLTVSVTTLGKVKLTLRTSIPTSIQFTHSNLITG